MAKRLHQKYLLPFTAIVLLLVMATSFLLYKQNGQGLNQPQVVELSTLDSKYWLPYRNDMYGFKLKYPPQVLTSGPLTKDDGTLLYIIKRNRSIGETDNYLLLIGFNDKLLDNPIHKINYEKLVFQQRTILRTYDLPGKDPAIAYFVPSKNGYISLYLAPYDKDNPFENQEENLKILNTVLSTISLTEPTPSTTLNKSDYTGGSYKFTTVRIQTANVKIFESLPAKVDLVISGNLSDGCKGELMVNQQQTGNHVDITLHRKLPVNSVCPAVEQGVNYTVRLSGDFYNGDYTYSINNYSGKFSVK